MNPLTLVLTVVFGYGIMGFVLLLGCNAIADRFWPRRKDTFKEDSTVVPLLWNHLRDDASDIIGHCILENREDGIYARCSLNDSGNTKVKR